MILILSSERDSHYIHVKKKLEKLGADFVLLDTSLFPADILASIKINNSGHDVVLEMPNKRRIRGKDIKTVWNRRKGQVSAPKGINSTAIREYISSESQFFLDSLQYVLSAHWVSRPDSITAAAMKPYQLLVAKDIGFSIPHSVIGNSRESVDDFIDQVDRDVAVKSVCRPSIVFDEKKVKTRGHIL